MNIKFDSTDINFNAFLPNSFSAFCNKVKGLKIVKSFLPIVEKGGDILTGDTCSGNLSISIYSFIQEKLFNKKFLQCTFSIVEMKNSLS